MTAHTPASLAERERFVDDLLAYMTLEEKAGQLVVLPSAPDPIQRRAQRDHAGFFDRLRTGLVGAVGGVTSAAQAEALQRIAIEESRLGIPLLFVAEGETGVDTVMPAPAAAAASWDTEAIEAAETAVAVESRRLGINWMLVPEIRLVDDCGDPEFAHSSGAEPHLAARIAVARIRGLQHEAIAGETGTLACLGLAEDGHHATHVPHRTGAAGSLEVAFAAVRDAQVGSIMIENGAHRLPGTRASTAHPVIEFLRRPGNYDGMILTEVGELAVDAGQDPLTRGLYELSVEQLFAATRQGLIDESRIDDAVRRVLRAKFDLGLFRTHSRRRNDEASHFATALPRAGEAAMELARRSIVLVRNADELLPLGIESGDLLVVGTAASDSSLPLAGRDGQAASVIDGLEGLGIRFKYVPGLALRHEGAAGHRLIEADRMAIGMACEAARRARTIIVVLGQGVAGARHNPLGEAQRQMLSALRTVNDRIVLVTLGSRPLNPAINGEPLPCIVHAGQLGTMSGHAIAEVLTGDFSPTGRLPAPLESREPARSLPFGHGLSYGRIGLANFSLEMGADRVLATLDLRNRGDFTGSETIQLYVRRNDDPRAIQQPGALRDYARVTLQPGERRRVTFEIGAEQLGTIDEDGRFSLDEGRYVIELGINRGQLSGAELVLPAAVAHAMRTRISGIGPVYGAPGQRRA